MDGTITTVVVAVLASNGLFAFIQYFITRHDSRKNVSGRLDKLEKDGLRTQLLLMIFFKPDDQTEILKIAEHYFVKLKANWYMTSIFKAWCDEKGLKPEWFD